MFSPATSQMISLFIAGGFGALVKDIVQDGKIEFPKKVDSALVLGSLGGVIVGAFAGWVIDGTPVTAALAGYVGTAIIEKMIKKISLG